MLSDEQIIVEIASPIGSPFDRLALEYQTDEILKFARAIERETTAQLIEQIKDDEALMHRILKALPSALPCGEFHHNAKDRHGIGEPCRLAGLYVEAVYMLRKRLEAKK